MPSAPQAHFTQFTAPFDMSGDSTTSVPGTGNFGMPGNVASYDQYGGSSQFRGFASYDLYGGSSQFGGSAVASPSSASGSYPSSSGVHHPPVPSHFASSSVPQPWYFDSGATNHLTNTLQNITQPQVSSLSDGVMVGNGSTLQVTHTDAGVIPTSHAKFHLSHVLHTPQITYNLISVYQFAKDNNCSLVFDSSGLVIQDKVT